MTRPPDHQFTVFSIVEDDGSVRPRVLQCNNCSVVHRVIDVCRSEIVNGRDTSAAALTVDDVKIGMPPKIVMLLEANDVDMATWEMTKFVLENKQWGTMIVLSSEEIDERREGKYLQLLGETLYRVESFVREETIRR